MYKVKLKRTKKVYIQLVQKKELAVLLILCTIIFMLLYHKILFGDYIYAYKDIGSDTIYSYIPNFIFDGEWIRSGKFSEYTLQYGLGIYIENPIFKYIIPFNFIFIFCNSENIGLLLVISLYMKIITIAVFSYFYFERLTDSKKAALVGALIWSFCSYMVVWGQHYQFGTRMALFTVGIYFLELYFSRKEKKVILTIVLMMMWFDSYYAIYMNGIFFALYIIVRGWQSKYSTKKIIQYLVGLMGMALIAAALSMVKLLPELMSLFSSTRMSDVLGAGNEMPWHYGKDYILSFIARFMSANIIGTGNSFSGAYNYYEVALLSTSLLSVFSFVFLMFTKYRKYIVAIGTVTFVGLYLPIVSQILNMNYLKQRWSYLLCFVFVISIVTFFAFMQKHRDNVIYKRRLKYSIVISDICYICICIVLLVAHKAGWVTLDKTVLLSTALIIIFYNVLLWWYSIRFNRYIWHFMFCAVFIELLVMNYPSINSRDMVSTEEWNNALYNDGTSAVIKQVQKEDSTIYRVNKSYGSVSGYNDALIQNYNGVCVYSSLNTKELVEFYTFWGYELLGGHPHYIFIPYEDYIMNTILGVKYLITDKAENISEQYDKLFEYNGFSVYENKCTLPFAYLYDTEFCKTDIELLTGKERQKALLYGFFVSDGEGTGRISKSSYTTNKTNEENDLVQLKNLRNNSASYFSYTKNGFEVDICNQDKKDAMLVISVIYNKNWSIYVDGKKQKLYNVNSGLIGTVITPGEHNIHLVYKQPEDSVAMLISLLSVVILIFFCTYKARKKRRF